MRLKLIPGIVLATLLVLFAPRGVASAQNGDNLCSQLIEDVISELGTNCANLLSGQVCYGYEIVEAMPIPGITFPDGAFDAPGERLPVTDVARIDTSPLDLEADPPTWGFAIVKTDAFIGMNEETGEPETAELVYIVPGGVELEAVNAPEYDEDGNLLIGEVDGQIYLGPMQEVYVRNLFEDPVCDGSIPPFLFVQSETNEEIDLIVNEETIRLAGTIVIEILTDGVADGEVDGVLLGDTLRVTTLFGLATLNPDTDNEIVLPPGYFAEICLDDPLNVGQDQQENDQPVGDCPWSDPAPLTQADLDRLAALELLPDNLIDPIDVPVRVVPSGVGAPQFQFVFTNPAALVAAQEACAATPPLLPEAICNTLF